MRLARLTTAALLTCGLAVATTLPAAAANRTTSDPKGDTVATFDITSLTVKNKTKELSVKVTVPGFDPSAGQSPDAYILGAYVYTRGIDYYIEGGLQAGEAGKFVSFQPHDDAWEDGNEGGEPCKGLRTVFVPGAAKLVIPQKCLGKDKGSVRVVAQFRGYSEDGNTTTEQGIDYTNEHPKHIKRG